MRETEKLPMREAEKLPMREAGKLPMREAEKCTNESGEKFLFPTRSGQRHVAWRRGVVASRSADIFTLNFIQAVHS
jgi:hypothetical protein